MTVCLKGLVIMPICLCDSVPLPKLGCSQSFARRKKAAVDNSAPVSSAEVFLWDVVPELGLLDQRVNTFVILTDMANLPPFERQLVFPSAMNKSYFKKKCPCVCVTIFLWLSSCPYDCLGMKWDPDSVSVPPPVLTACLCV